jgi:hypothetical protein
MSIRVDLAELQHHATARPFAYLLTTGDDGRPHVIAVSPAFLMAGTTSTGTPAAPDHLEVDAGGRTARNAAARPQVALVWPPETEGGYSLVVDADASVADEPAGTSGVCITLRPTSAVLHRPAPAPAPSVEAEDRAEAAADGAACTADCVRIPLS